MSKLIGMTRIELTDVRTGEKEVHEKHNMVTNALRDLFRPIGLLNNPQKYFGNYVPYYATLLGGLLLFDQALPENADNYFAPADATLVGCGVYNQATAPTELYRGSYNSVESEINTSERYIKYVYDYGTTQANNGTIASVCLTHIDCGYGGYELPNANVVNNTYVFRSNCTNTLDYVTPSRTGGQTKSRCSNTISQDNEYIFLIDKSDDVAYYFKFTDTTNMHIIKRRLFLKTVNVFDDPTTIKPIVDNIELEELPTSVNFNRLSYNYDTVTDKLYIITHNNVAFNVGDSINVLEVDFGTWTTNYYTIVNSTEDTLVVGDCQIYVTDGYVYAQKYSYGNKTRVYKIKLDNYADVTEISHIDNTTNFHFQCIKNGRLYLDYSGYPYMLNTRTNAVRRLNCSKIFEGSSSRNGDCNAIPVRNDPLMVYCATSDDLSWINWYYQTNYLATINNLDVPVTKTADKAMKITYILQEE